MTFKQMT